MKSIKAFNLASTKKKLPHVLDRKTSKGAKDLDSVGTSFTWYTKSIKDTAKELYKSGDHFRWSNEKLIEVITDTSGFKNKVLPMLIDMYIRDKRVSRNEAEMIRGMINSSDTENWILAIALMKNLKKYK